MSALSRFFEPDLEGIFEKWDATLVFASTDSGQHAPDLL